MAPTSLEGQSLGKYRILEPLGRGGMAEAWLATNGDRQGVIKKPHLDDGAIYRRLVGVEAATEPGDEA